MVAVCVRIHAERRLARGAPDASVHRSITVRVRRHPVSLASTFCTATVACRPRGAAGAGVNGLVRGYGSDRTPVRTGLASGRTER